MKVLFIITSAIISAKSNEKSEHEERFLQTLHTIDSIKSRIPTADIWLCDSSSKQIPTYMKTMLGEVKIIEFYQDKKIHEIIEKANSGWLKESNLKLGQIKNMTETYVLNKTFQLIDQKDYDRIFKISGRYFLTNKFNIKQHSDYGKISLKEEEDSVIMEHNLGIKKARKCVLWSCCTSILDEIKKSFLDIEEYIHKGYKDHFLADIEHGFTQFIDDSLIYEIDKTGVVGRVDGEKIHAD